MNTTANQDVITIKCIFCGHVWQESIAELEKQDQIIYRAVKADPKREIVQYRVTCPQCGQGMIVSVQVSEAET